MTLYALISLVFPMTSFFFMREFLKTFYPVSEIFLLKTHKIKAGDNLHALLDKYLPELEENSVVAIASKIVGICEGRVVKIVSEG